MLQFITSIFSLAGALTAAIISVILSYQGFKNKIRFSYFLAVTAGSLWLFTYTIWLWTNNYDMAVFLLRIVMMFAIFTYPTFLHFVFAFVNYKNKLLIYAAYLSAAILAYFCLFTNLFMKGVSEKISYLYWPNRGGIVFDIYVLMWIIVIFISLTLLFRSFRETKDPFKRSQIRIILVGAILGYIGGATNFFLWYDIPIPPFGNIVVPIYFSLIAYAILKYRFADIRLVIRRSAVFTILVLLITALYSLLSYLISLFFTNLIGVQSVIFNGVLTAIFVAVGFEPLKKTLSISTDKFLFKAEYNPEEVLAEFSDKLASTLDLEQLKHFVVNRLEQTFKTTYVSLFLLDENRKEYMRSAVAGTTKESLPKIEQKLFAKIFNFLKTTKREHDTLVRDEIKGINEQLKNPILNVLLQQMETYEVNIISPLYQSEKLVGILFFGDKKSGDVFSTEDLRLVEIIAAQTAVAMQNAKLYEEQKKFAIHLKKEVDNATKELRIANVQLKKLDEAKSEFISIASHQLRTPLTVIKGYLSMVEQGDFGKVPAKVSLPLDRVYKSTLRIINLVEDLLNVSRIESGRMKYDFANVDLNEVITDVFEELQQTAKNKGLKFSYIKSKEKIPLIILDKQKIREVIMNLMDNAIKYTEAGFVAVKLERLDNHVEFSVSDNGRGVDADEMPQLFQKFSRAKGVQQMHTEGTGLGLYIAKQIIERHGGEIGAKSAGLGKGSTFYIRFKIENKKLEKEITKEK